MPCCAVLCCAVLCCATLCCAVLCSAVLRVLCCAVLCCAVLCCAVLCCAVLCCAVLHCAALCCPVLCCVAVRRSTLCSGCPSTRHFCSVQLDMLGSIQLLHASATQCPLFGPTSFATCWFEKNLLQLTPLAVLCWAVMCCDVICHAWRAALCCAALDRCDMHLSFLVSLTLGISIGKVGVTCTSCFATIL